MFSVTYKLFVSACTRMKNNNVNMLMIKYGILSVILKQKVKYHFHFHLLCFTTTNDTTILT